MPFPFHFSDFRLKYKEKCASFGRLVGLLWLIILPFSLFSQLSVSVDNDYHHYQQGDTISFTIKSSITDSAHYVINRNQYLPDISFGNLLLQSGQATTLQYIPTEPGNYYCTVTQGNTSASAAGVYNKRQLSPIVPAPDDFEDYWNDIRNQLNAVPFDLHIKEDTNYLSDFSTTYQLDMGIIDGHRMYAYMTIPKTSGVFTGLVKFPAFGNSSAVHPDLSMSERLGAIVISLSVHNAPVTVDLPQEEQYSPDIGQTDTVYYRWAMAAGMRAIDYLYSRSDFDGEHIGVFGNSQGAGLAFLFSGIDPRVDLVAINNPIMSQHNGLAYGKPSGFPVYIRDHLNEPLELQRILDAVKYYDAVYAAQRFDGPILASVSLLDEVNPAETTYTALNQLKGKVIHLHNLHGHHENTPSEFWESKFDFFRRYFPTNNTWPWVPSTIGYQADAGLDKTTNCLATDIEGTIDFNGTSNPSDIPVHWELVSGPGTVTFDHPFSHATTIHCSQPGNYTLRFVGEKTSNLTSESVYWTIEDQVKLTICPDNDCFTPTIQIPAQDLIINCQQIPDSLSLWLNQHGGAHSNSPNITWSHNFSQIPNGCNPSTNVLFIATNNCGLSDSTTAAIHLQDSFPPSITTPAGNQTVYCQDPNIDIELNEWLAQNGGAIASQNCTNVTWTNNFTGWSDDCQPMATVVFTATNECGLSDSTTATFQIVDSIPFAILAQAKDTTVQCDGNGNQNDLDAWLAQNGGAIASQNCSDVTWTHHILDWSDDCQPMATVVFTATNECGLSDSTTATFQIVDSIPFAILAQAKDTTVQCDGNGNQNDLDAWLAQNGGAIASQNCSDVTWTNHILGWSDDCQPMATVVFTATNECGLSDSTTATFQIVDSIPFAILAQATDTTVQCDGNGNQNDLDAWLAQNGGAIASQNCSDVTWTHHILDWSDDCQPMATVVFTAVNDCNEKDTTMATFMIIDTIPPTFTVLPDTLHLNCNQTGNFPELEDWLNNHGGAMASDQCSLLSWSNNFDTIDCNDTIQNIQFTVADSCDNTSTAIGVIDINHTTGIKSTTANDSPKILSIYPIPFRDKAKIVFYLSKAQPLKFTFYNAEGMVLTTIRKEFQAGIQELSITQKELKAHGMVFFRMESPKQTIVGKMMITKQ